MVFTFIIRTRFTIWLLNDSPLSSASFPQITEDVRAYAREHGYGVDEKVFEVGMENMSKEFAKVGQVYTEETELANKLGKE